MSISDSRDEKQMNEIIFGKISCTGSGLDVKIVRPACLLAPSIGSSVRADPPGGWRETDGL